MIDWDRGRFEYYLDFAMVPFLGCTAVTADVFYHGITAGLLGTAVFGFLLWSFLEYWIHRVLFHRVFRRPHGQHHRDPGGYVAAPAWLTTAAHCFLLASCIPLGSAGIGLFAGLEAGYFGYIGVHDAIHHRKLKAFGWLRRRHEEHMMHHQGVEVNFGVVFKFWDKVFGTYRNPRQGGHFCAKWFDADKH